MAAESKKAAEAKENVPDVGPGQPAGGDDLPTSGAPDSPPPDVTADSTPAEKPAVKKAAAKPKRKGKVIARVGGHVVRDDGRGWVPEKGV